MAKINRPRYGSLQFYPRKRVDRRLPRVNWDALSKSSVISKEDSLNGIVAYKVGMASAMIKDNTDKSLSHGKKVYLPCTILEVPPMKLFSVRFYKNGTVMTEIIVSNDKELRRTVKVPKETNKDLGSVEGFDDLRVIAYSLVKETGLKKKPDMIELSVNSSDKLNFVKSLIGKEITLSEMLKWNLVDVRGLTKGKGLQGPVKRFGIKLKSHKSEKGRRRPGSLGPWHPARVTFRVAMSGQLGMFTRVHYNLRVLHYGSTKNKEDKINPDNGFAHYGKINTDYIILKGSVQGPQKRQILVTPALRPNRKQSKKKYEFLGLAK